MNIRTVFFIGKPGSGKGTQAQFLSGTTGWPAFSSGELFRAIAREDTPVGRKVKAEGDAGILQPHWFAMYLYLKTLFSIPEDSGVIFDGFSRKPPEAALAIEALQWINRPFSALYLRVSDEEVARRLALRREHSGRADDAFVEKRLEEYRAHTEPCIELFRAAGALIELDGEGAREAIAADVRAALGLSVLPVAQTGVK